jgi:hypothetical protein
MSRRLSFAVIEELLKATERTEIHLKAFDSWNKHGVISLHWIPRSQEEAIKLGWVLRQVRALDLDASDLKRLELASKRVARFAERRGWSF